MSRSSICRLMLLLLPIAGEASGGAWPREEGGVFLSFSGERDRAGNSHASLYGEYGVTPRNTLGLKFDRASAGERGALIWLQRTLDDGTGPNRWAVSLGLGAIERDGAFLPQGQIGAAWGRGIGSPIGDGWLSVEMRVNVAGAPRDFGPHGDPAGVGYLARFTPETAAKLDATFGLHLTPAMMLINQLRLEEREDTGFSGRLATSVVHDLAGPAKIELGVVTPLSGAGERVLKVGSWLEF